MICPTGFERRHSSLSSEDRRIVYLVNKDLIKSYLTELSAEHYLESRSNLMEIHDASVVKKFKRYEHTF